MTREINGRITMRVSDDGTRCAAECPHMRAVDGGPFCAAHRTELQYGVVPPRLNACIAAEQAAASVPSWQPIETAPRKRRVMIHVTGNRGMDYACVGQLRSCGTWRDDTAQMLVIDGEITHWMPLPEAPGVPASAQSDHLDGGARALDASEALREARVQGMREAMEIVLAYTCGASSKCSRALEAAIEAVRKGER